MTAPPLTARDAAALVLIATIWGTNTFLTKIVVDQVPPLFVLVLRFGITLAALAPFVRPMGAMWKPLLLVSLLTGPIHFGLQFPGLAMATDLSPMVIAMQLWIPLSVLMSALFLKDRIRPLPLMGMVVSFAGIVILAIEPSVLTQLGAFALVAAAGAAYAAASVLMRRYGALDPLQAQAWIAIVTIPLLGAASAATEQQQWTRMMEAGWFAWFAIGFAALGSGVLANVWMWTILKRQPVSRTTPWMLAAPIVSLSLGIVVLDDPVTPQLAIGLAVALIGIAITALANRPQTKAV
jgi:O-acetylserine/cysteine efflux transporter